MLSFLNRKIPTVVGILILLFVAASVGAMVFWQFHQIMQIHIETISSLQEQP